MVSKLIIDNRTELSDADALLYVMSTLDQQTVSEREGRLDIKTRAFRKLYGGRDHIFVNYERMKTGEKYTVFT